MFNHRHLRPYQPPSGRNPRRDADPAPDKQSILSMSEDAAELMRIVTDALRPFPDARTAVVSALEK